MECENCPYRTLCTQSQTGRRIQRATIFTKFRNESLKNITTEKGILLRMNRSIQVEGAFGVLKQDYGFRRFLTRGSENVKIEMLLLCFAFNINKLHKKTIKKEEIHIFLKKWLLKITKLNILKQGIAISLLCYPQNIIFQTKRCA